MQGEFSGRFQREAGSEFKEFKELGDVGEAGEVSGSFLFSLNSLLKPSPPQNKNCPTPYEPSSGDTAH